jgi:hypothetical protein
VDGELGQATLRFQCETVSALHSLQGTGDREWLAAEHFQLGAQFEVVGRVFRPAKSRISQAAEVIAARVAAAAGDGGGQELMGAPIVAGEVGMHPPPIQLIQQRVLGDAD